jgi:regulator of nonsense transcripts 3
VRQESFQDARHTSNDPILLGPPSLEYAAYAKIPGSRSRKDARQGTIDQDSDFIAFLESLTQPITKPAAVDSMADVEEKKKESVLTTPLVQYIKDKKASKSKDGGSKSSKNSRAEKESKQEKVMAKKLLQRSDKEASSISEKKGRGEKTSKESTKTTKQAAASAKAGKSAATSSTTKENTPAPERKKERGNVAAATKILQRDLGVSTSGGRRRGKGGAGDTGSPKTESSRDSALSAEVPKKESVKSAKNASTSTKPKEESSSRASEASPAPATNPPAKVSKGGKAKAAASPAPNATQAFLKHANPSQGVTEALLEAAFNPFGTVTKVEIDKKKGFGYVSFLGPEGLQKAIAASPVPVAQSQVVVLERKANSHPGADKSRKGRDVPAPSVNKGKAGEGAGSNAGSSRGSRGGRGSRNKGPKGANASAPVEKTGGSEAT